MTSQFPEGVKGPSEIQPTKRIEGNEGLQKPASQPFSSYMEGNNATASQQALPSPMDVLNEGKIKSGDLSPTSVLNRLNSTSTTLGNMQNQLQTKNLQLRPEDTMRIRSNLTKANESIRYAADIAQVPHSKEVPKKRNPIEKFLTLISDGQSNLNEIQNKVSKLGSDGKDIDFTEIMRIQIQLSKAQREVELASIILSKALSSMQMLFNVQI